MSDNWFSNFIPGDEPINFLGVDYPTIEHFYQAMKTNDKSEKLKIAKCKTPGQAKRMGRKVKLIDNWEALKNDAMLIGLLIKFQPGTRPFKKLMSTMGDIVEWNHWHDNYWGDCTCSKCKDLPGQNHLGKLLSDIRDKYRQIDKENNNASIR